MKFKIYIFFTFILVLINSCESQPYNKYDLKIKNYQSDLIAFYNSEESPIRIENKNLFRGLTFFPIEKKYNVEVIFAKIFKEESINVKTSADQERKYIRYGEITFDLNDKINKLTVFQRSPIDPKHPNSLFLPFFDETNALTSYGGGRYLDLDIDDIEDSFRIDFNKAYNPYCAYEDGYSCMIPPIENKLDIEIKAGVSYNNEH